MTSHFQRKDHIVGKRKKKVIEQSLKFQMLSLLSCEFSLHAFRLSTVVKIDIFPTLQSSSSARWSSGCYLRIAVGSVLQFNHSYFQSNSISSQVRVHTRHANNEPWETEGRGPVNERCS